MAYASKIPYDSGDLLNYFECCYRIYQTIDRDKKLNSKDYSELELIKKIVKRNRSLEGSSQKEKGEDTNVPSQDNSENVSTEQGSILNKIKSLQKGVQAKKENIPSQDNSAGEDFPMKKYK